MVAMVKNTHTYHSDLVNISTNFLRRLESIWVAGDLASRLTSASQC